MKYYEDYKQVLNQDILREVESLCIQDEPPACTAACPVHLNARTMIEHIKSGDWKQAYQLYQKAIPFPRIVSRTCTAPCQDVCKRNECGGTIEVQKLESYLVSRMAQEVKAPLFLPKKAKKIAVIGGSLRGLTAVYELAKKGYKLSLFEASEKLGGRLRQFSGDILSEQDIELDLDAVRKLPVEIRYGETVPCGNLDEVTAFMTDAGFDAVYIACDSPIEGDARTLETSAENVLSGHRDGRRHEGYSSIYEIYDGRSAAITIDRLMQKVSTLAGREKEGSADTALYTSLDGVDSEPAASDEISTEAQALAEAGRCLNCQCLECVKKCSFLQRHKSYPGRYVREVYNNLSIPLGTRHANTMINTCALCSQCEAVCPNGLDMKSVFLGARRMMVETGKMPQSAHEFALLDMDYSMSDAFFLSRGDGEGGDGESCNYVFFPGCQLPASEPELVRRVYVDLRYRLGSVGLMLSCCGIIAHWAGDGERFDAALEKIRAEWERMGKPVIITACPSCRSTLGDLAGLPVTGIWDILWDYGLPPQASDVGASEMTLHNACGARYDNSVKDAVRGIAFSVGCTVTETEGRSDESPCCGYGGLLPFADEDKAAEMTGNTLALHSDTVPVLTYCVNCRDRFIKKGAESYHLLELCYGTGAKRHQPTWSERQENRAALKREILADIWGEVLETKQGLELELGDGVLEKMESLKILRSDLAAAIMHAEAENKKFVSKSGHFIAGYRPGNVTFWVEYEYRDGVYFIFNTYMHRMMAEVTFEKRGERRGEV